LEREPAARRAAARVSRAKDEFLATLSHELRTPLNAILGWAQLLRNGNSAPEDTAMGLETIERNARVQTQLIEELLDMSRIISGKLRLDVQRVDLPTVVDDAVESFRPATDAKGIKLYKVIDPKAAPVTGDPSRLQQVVWNLVSNAVKFTPRKGSIQVFLQRVNSHVEISVSDSGQGIDAKFLPHLFARFSQADSSSTRHHGGLGLGLAIVKHLVELHGGAVTAMSAGLGQGSTFTVTLPLAPLVEPRRQEDGPPRSMPVPTATAPFAVNLSDVKVLVVDDEVDARALVKRLLETNQATVLTAASAAEAVEVLTRERPHLLVTDIGMPGTDGYQLLQQVRALPAGAGGDIPAVALTAFARSEDRRRALLAGFQLHVSKPVEPAELLAVVANVAKRGRV
jgi:CheY-like chemotaxis protein/two-component sensor histidine kinase